MHMIGSKMFYSFLALAGVVVIVVVLLLRTRASTPGMKWGEILPAGELKAKYGLTIENYEPPPLDPEKVPEHLRDLLPLARTWGIADDVIRGDWQEKASEQDKIELKTALKGRGKTINEWLDSFGERTMPDEAAAFMYMAVGLDEMGIRVESDDRDH